MMTGSRRHMKITFILAFCIALVASASAKPIMPKHLKVMVGQQAPDFAIPAGNGDPVRLSDLRGHNVLLYFYRGYW